MTTKYLKCKVFHPGKEEFVTVDIEVLHSVNEYNDQELVCEDIMIPITNEFLDNGFSVVWDDEEAKLYDNYSQPDYVGTVNEIMCRILSE